MLERALRHLQPDHFADQSYRNIFVVLDRYYAAAGAVVTRAAFADLLSSSGADPGLVALYCEKFDALLLRRPEDHEFAWSVKMLQEHRAHELTGAALTAGLEQLRGTVDPPKHLENLPPSYRARAVVTELFAKADRELNMADSPEGDVRTEYQDILQDYATRVSLSQTGRQGVLFGVPDIDIRTSGAQNGDLVVISGFTAVGKSQFCAHLAHEVSVHQGRNVAFLTSETIRSQVRRRLVARHSREPQFGIPDGINSRDLKAGSLPEHMVGRLESVVKDLTTGPYGKLHLAQIPRGATISTVEARLHALQRSWDIDLVVIDYLALLTAERKRDAGWQEKSDLVISAKQMAVTFADGRGVPVVTPWQMSRAAYERAQKTGFWTLADHSETAELEKSSDLIIPLFRTDDDQTGRRATLRAQILKNRDGELADSIPLECDFATCWYRSPKSAQSIENLLES